MYAVPELTVPDADIARWGSPASLAMGLAAHPERWWRLLDYRSDTRWYRLLERAMSASGTVSSGTAYIGKFLREIGETDRAAATARKGQAVKETRSAGQAHRAGHSALATRRRSTGDRRTRTSVLLTVNDQTSRSTSPSSTASSA